MRPPAAIGKRLHAAVLVAVEDLVAGTLVRVAGDVLWFAFSSSRSHATLAAENLFLRNQLALYVERGVKPRRAHDGSRVTLVALSRNFYRTLNRSSWSSLPSAVFTSTRQSPGSSTVSRLYVRKPSVTLVRTFSGTDFRSVSP